MSQTISARLPTGALLNSNQRQHWAVKANRNRMLRDHAHVLARASGLTPMGRVNVTVTIAYPKGTSRRRDAHNLAPTLKPMLDGIVDAGVLRDDSDEYVASVTYRAANANTGEAHMWRITITLDEVAQ